MPDTSAQTSDSKRSVVLALKRERDSNLPSCEPAVVVQYSCLGSSMISRFWHRIMYAHFLVLSMIGHDRAKPPADLLLPTVQAAKCSGHTNPLS